MYKKIVNPLTGKKVNINSRLGKNILYNYITFSQIGGKYVSHGANKCVFSPVIKCKGESVRYGEKDGDSPNNYVSAIMKNSEADLEIKELDRLLSKIDPEGEFTIGKIKKCKIGELDEEEEHESEFDKCKMNSLKNYSYPYDNLVQIIFPNGGMNTFELKLKISKNEIFVKIKKMLIGFKTVLNGLKKMKDNKFIHSDIKSTNILYNIEKNKYYIIDFGMAIGFNEVLNSSKSDIYYNNYISKKKYEYWPIDIAYIVAFYKNLNYISYLLKEMKNILKLDESFNDIPLLARHSIIKFDIYSLGITLQEIFGIGYEKQESKTNKGELYYYNSLNKKKIWNKPLIDILAEQERYSETQKKEVKEKLLDIVIACIQINPIKRITIEQLIEKYDEFIDFLNNINKS